MRQGVAELASHGPAVLGPGEITGQGHVGEFLFVGILLGGEDFGQGLVDIGVEAGIVGGQGEGIDDLRQPPDLLIGRRTAVLGQDAPVEIKPPLFQGEISNRLAQCQKRYDFRGIAGVEHRRR